MFITKNITINSFMTVLCFSKNKSIFDLFSNKNIQNENRRIIPIPTEALNIKFNIGLLYHE